MGKRPRGSVNGWRPRTARQKAILDDLVARYEQHEADDTLPRGPRGMFYDLRPAGMGHGATYRKPDSAHPVSDFDPMEVHPAAVQEVLALARRAGIIRESWVADQRAPSPLVPSYAESAEDEAEGIAYRIEHAAEWFRLDRQRDQPAHIEVLCEAEDLAPRLSRVARDYGVPVYPSAGFDGLKGKRAFAERAINRDAPTVVLHVGDRDDHGDRIYISAAEDACAWAGRGAVIPVSVPGTPGFLSKQRDVLDGEAGLYFVRLALTATQANDLGLLDADGKAEVDGVPVPVMDRWLTEAIEALQLPARRERLLAEEDEQRERLPEAIREALDGGR
jgi:hypothetical protein